MRNLFYFGDFTLHSGEKSNFLIDVNALSDEELTAVAQYALGFLSPYRWVVPILQGGLRFANALAPFADKNSQSVLIVDDVYTTGKSMEEALRILDGYPHPVWGVVLFSRAAATPNWIYSCFTTIQNYQ